MPREKKQGKQKTFQKRGKIKREEKGPAHSLFGFGVLSRCSGSKGMKEQGDQEKTSQKVLIKTNEDTHTRELRDDI